jgi:amino acid transporter
MKRKKLPIILYKKESKFRTPLLVVVAFGLIASLGFQLYLLNEIEYLWGELDELYTLIEGVLEQLQSAQFTTKPYL